MNPAQFVMNLPKILAHRGLSKLAPENSLTAFELAKAHNIHWLEFDVMLTADNCPIVFHDESLKRITGKSGLIATHTWDSLKSLDIGVKFDKKFKGARIPTLVQTLDFLKENHLQAVLEIKPTSNTDIKTAEVIIKLIEKIWPEGFKYFIFSSFSLASLLTVRQLLPEQNIGFGLHLWRDFSAELIKAFNCKTIHVNQLILTPKRVKSLKKTGCHILAYTVNSRKRALKLHKWGVDGFFSDRPHKLAEVL